MPKRTSLNRKQTLIGKRREVVCAIAEAMFAEDGEVSRERLEQVVDQVDAFIAATSPLVRLGLRFTLFFVRLAPILMFFRASLLENLPLTDRVAFLARLERSPRAGLSLAFIGWRTMLTLVFYEDKAELQAIGYGEERRRYKRALPVLAPAIATAAPVPIPLESGVRLRDDAPSMPSHHAADEQEVA